MSIQAQSMIANATTGSLGTIDRDGRPFVSMITVAGVGRAQLVTLLSGLAKHTRHLKMRSECSLLLVESGGAGGDPLAVARITLNGSVRKLDKHGHHRDAFLARHQAAEMYVDFEDFEFYGLTVEQAYLVAGFGKIESIPASKL